MMDREPLSVGEKRPGLRGARSQGQTTVLAFYPDEWDPSRPAQLAAYPRGVTLACRAGRTCWESLRTTPGFSLRPPRRVRLRFPLVQDSRLAEAFGVVQARQAVFVIDPEGIVRWSHVGPVGSHPQPRRADGERPPRAESRRLAAAASRDRRRRVARLRAPCPVPRLPKGLVGGQTKSAPAGTERAITLNVNGQAT